MENNLKVSKTENKDEFKVEQTSAAPTETTVIKKEALEEAIASYKKEADKNQAEVNWRQKILDEINKIK